MLSKKILIGIRGKLVIIFILIKVIPLLLLAWIAWKGVDFLGKNVSEQTIEMTKDMQNVVTEVGNNVIKNSISALDLRSREAVERMTTDTAKAIADFLYQRDKDIRQASGMELSEESFKRFLSTHTQFVTGHDDWILSPDNNSWIPKRKPQETDTIVTALLEDNKEFRYRVPEKLRNRMKRPLYLEMTFVNPEGMEKLKVTTGNLLPSELRDVSEKENTWCRAETYFQYLKNMKPGEIYVSDVIGPYVGSKIIGNYTPNAAEKKGIPFEPEKAAYAGKENPVGKHFQGLIRWATPIEKNGNVIGYITLALDHRHIMEFSDHILPTEERYTSISDASSGNYAFIFNYNSQCISHPRDYYILGYEPETGEPAPFWMEQEMYNGWKKSGLKLSEFIKQVPFFHEQSFKKKPALEQIQSGTLGLDGRFLNFTPQCTDWHNLTRYGGSGSFVTFWSGLWKLYTIAAIPYYTGQYGNTPRGFGYAAMCANVDEFHRPALETKDHIDRIVKDYENEIRRKQQTVENMIGSNIRKTTKNLFFYTMIMILIIIGIAVWIASVITDRIKNMIHGIQRFQEGELDYRLKMSSSDEIGLLGYAFDSMADSIEESYKKSEDYIDKLKKAEEKYRGIFENAIEGIYQSTPDGKFRSANPALASILGYDSPEDLIRNVTNIGEQLYVTPESRSEVFRLVREHGVARGFETPFYRKDKSKIWVSLNTRPVYDENGKMLFVEGMLEDITQRKEKEELEKTYKARLEKDVEERTRELRHTNAYLENVLENSADGIGIADTQGKIVSWNKAASKLYGYTYEEIIGTSFSELYTDKNELEKMLSELRNNGFVKRHEIRMRKKYGTDSPFELSIALLKDEDKKNIGSICVVRDLSEIKKALTETRIARETAEKANKKITDSINYAKMIQQSLLANLDVVKSYIPNSFFIWEPRDIVGGDIFFTEKFEDGFIVAVVDCTGHGVPGAFMTMIAVSALRRIIKDEECRDPAEILKRLNVIVKTTLHQDTAYAVSDDGMDVGIVRMENVSIESHAFGFQSSELMFAGAKVPLYYVRRGEINIIKGDRESIGYRRSDVNFSFTNHKISIEKGMCFYMATDGFADQIGGNGERRFGTAGFKNLLKEISGYPFEKQRSMLIQAFEEHRGDNDRQDDMTVAGFGF